jgi:hypothetical protein
MPRMPRMPRMPPTLRMARMVRSDWTDEAMTTVWIAGIRIAECEPTASGLLAECEPTGSRHCGSTWNRSRCCFWKT